MSALAVLGPDPRFGGGSAAQTRAFLDAASAAGHDPTLLYVPHPVLAERPATWTLDRVEALRLVRGSGRLVAAVRSAEKCWIAGPLAIHGYAAARSGRSYACWLGTSVADETRGRVPGLPPARRVAAFVNAPALRRLEQAVLKNAGRVYATSPASREALEAAGVDGPVGILPLPVDVELFAPEADDVWLARLDRPVLAVVGRADDPRRNVRLAVDAFTLIRRRRPEARLRVIGPRPPTWLAAEQGVDVLGEVASVAEPLRECSLMLLPSRQEGFGLAAAEALASGVPVVSTPSGGPEDLLGRSGGGVVTEGWTAAELAERAVELLGSAATLVEMRRRGRDHVVREHAPERVRTLVAAAIAEAE